MMRFTPVLLTWAVGGLGVAGRAPAIEAQTWTSLESSTPHEYHSAVVVEGKIYVLGGMTTISRAAADFEMYDPSTNSWRSLPQMPTPRLFLAAAAVGSKIYAIGGIPVDHPRIEGTTRDSTVGTVEVFDIGTGSWSTGVAMPTPRSRFVAVTISDVIYVIGGMGSGGDKATVEAFDPNSREWSRKADMPTPRHGLGATVIDGGILVAGGYHPRPLETVELYDPRSDEWSEATRLPTPRGFFGMAAVKGYVYAIGGRVRGEPPVERYDARSDEWVTLAPMPGGFRNRFAMVAVGDAIYVIGGEFQGERHTPRDLLRYAPGTR